MGNGGSLPRIQINEQDPPAGSDENSIVYPDRPGAPRLTGLTRSLANDCAPGLCTLTVVPEISSSSVKLTREFGAISARQCRRYYIDKARLDAKEMSLQDFLSKLQLGSYYMLAGDGGGGHCKQVELSDEDLEDAKKKDAFDESKVKTVRIQKVVSGGFSASTKARFTPSIPFKMTYSTPFGPMPVDVRTMTLYHPCPLRVDDIQADAVLSLNDPSFGNPNLVILVPLVGRDTGELSSKFFSKIASEIVAVSSVNPATGEYISRDIPTGANWSLAKLFGVSDKKGGVTDVPNGHYRWQGMPPLERKRSVNGLTINYTWEPGTQGAPTYVMLDTPIVIASNDLASITQRLPITPPLDAIHAVLYNPADPLNRGIVHKQGPPITAEECSTNALYREMFTNADLNGVTNESCDAWETWAQTRTNADDLIAILLGVILTIAAAIGAYIALIAVSKYYDVELRGISETIGKVTGVYARNLKEKVAKVRNAVGNLRNIASNPGAAAKGFAMDSAQDSLGMGSMKPTGMKMGRRR